MLMKVNLRAATGFPEATALMPESVLPRAFALGVAGRCSLMTRSKPEPRSLATGGRVASRRYGGAGGRRRDDARGGAYAGGRGGGRGRLGGAGGEGGGREGRSAEVTGEEDGVGSCSQCLRRE